MGSSPKLSVCIPAYNAAQYVWETVLSCLTDTMWSIEIIISDNHSKDDTATILSELAHAHPDTIRLVRPDLHLSMAQNWNFTMSHARGEYVLLLSADDLLTPGICDDAITTFENDPTIDIVSYEHDRLVHEGDGTAIVARPVARHLDPAKPLTVSKLLTFNPLSINFSFIRAQSKAIESCRVKGQLFSRDLMTTDFDFWIKTVLQGAKITYRKAPKALYRVHGGNLSGAKRRMIIQTFLTLSRHRERLIDQAAWAFRLVMLRLFIRLALSRKDWRRNGRILGALPQYIFLK